MYILEIDSCAGDNCKAKTSLGRDKKVKVVCVSNCVSSSGPMIIVWKLLHIPDIDDEDTTAIVDDLASKTTTGNVPGATVYCSRG